jgi:hypothetical protein
MSIKRRGSTKQRTVEVFARSQGDKELQRKRLVSLRALDGVDNWPATRSSLRPC